MKNNLLNNSSTLQPFNHSTIKTFSSKKVLITGHTGFKGTWLCLWLEMLVTNLLKGKREFAQSWNFGSEKKDIKTVEEIVKIMNSNHWQKKI